MSPADTPKPERQPGRSPDDRRDGTASPADDATVEANPQLESDSSLPEDEDAEDEDPESGDTGQRPA